MRFIITTIVSILLIQPVASKSFKTMDEQLKQSIQQRSQAMAKAESRAKSHKTNKITISQYVKKETK